MFPLRILRKAWNDNFIFERKYFTEILFRGEKNKKVKICSRSSPFYSYSRNINTSRKCLNQDPYTVLGLSKNATTSEIKKQFRLLAKKYHPDINPSPDAKQKMASITAAYELLSDPKKKEFYDKTGMTDDMNYENQSSSNFEGSFSGFGDASFMFTDFAEMFTNMAGTKSSSTRGEDIQTEITLKFMEAIKGCEKNIRLNVKVSCNNCNGTGKKPGTNLTICKVCNGSGIQRMERGPIIIGVPCRNCSGNGQIINNPCKHCSGSGVKFQTKNITLDIPPGIKKGMQMRIPNQGHSGYRGGKNGHLFVTINIEPHKVFKWVDDNIYVDVPLTIKQCLLGGVVNIPTLNGDMDLLIRPKTYPNSEKVLKGKGPCKVDSHTNGDLIIKFSLKIPDKLTHRQVELIEEFNRIEMGLSNTQNTNRPMDDCDNASARATPKGDTSTSGSTSGINNKNRNNNSSGNSTDNRSINNSGNCKVNANERGEKNIPKPPPLSQKKKYINKLEGTNSSNVPIPPPPPTSSSSASKEKYASGRSANKQRAKEQNANGHSANGHSANGHSANEQNANERSANEQNTNEQNANEQNANEQNNAANEDSKLNSNMNNSYSYDDNYYSSKVKNTNHMKSVEHANSVNNSNINQVDNTAYIFDKSTKESLNFSNQHTVNINNGSSGTTISSSNSIGNGKNNNKSDDSYKEERDKKRSSTTSTFSYAKKWITEKLKPNN
ncbi:DnaJ protein, putative [Plasmodium malariae]|uniref:DnaJ protein, putative n=1 Tax=Plasmodium malariae TaxID=5858 RepID=A0A1A8VNJ6_PLAMA|nr:DnaJ protein, putative [Plasmodium malariae]